MRGYDAWLEAPYVDAAAREEAFEKWCEENDVEFDAPDAWDRFDEEMADRAQDAAEEEAERRAEARAERDDSDW